MKIDALDLCTSCGAHWPYDKRLEETEKLARFQERAAVVKYLRGGLAIAQGLEFMTLQYVADAIEKGEHHK